MPKLDVKRLAQELFEAQQKGSMVMPPTSRDLGFDLAAAYAVEAELRCLRAAQGAAPVGRKLGYANKAMWRILKLETLVWGSMYSDTVRRVSDNHARVSLERIRSAKIEPEIVFGLRERPRGEMPDAEAALQAVEWIAIGFEIIDCPYPDWQFKPADFVASFGLHAALIVGESKAVDANLIPTLIEMLPRFGVKVFKNGEFIEQGTGKNVLRSPAACLAELARAAALQPGEIISSGTLTAGHLIERGETWRVEVEDLPLPALTIETY